MRMSQSERDKIHFPIFVTGLFLLCLTIYWFGYAFFDYYGLTVPFLDSILRKATAAGYFASPWKLKGIVLLLVLMNVGVKSGASPKTSWPVVIIINAAGLVFFLFPFRRAVPFIVFTFLGYILLIRGVSLVVGKHRKLKASEPDNDRSETFEQCEEPVNSDDFVTIKTRYKWKGKWRTGYINSQLFRAAAVYGVPGSGKSFSIYGPYMTQMMEKAFTCFLYDYKYPALTEQLYNDYLDNAGTFKKKIGKVPKFCVINFDDPRYSMRCNPLNPMYLKSPADAAEVADIIMLNVNPKGMQKEDFFTLSAKALIDGMVWFLRIVENGRYCTLPHLIELMSRDYKATFKMLMKHEDIRVKIQPFQNALKEKAQEQLQGQLASAQMPLLRFASPELYWVLSGDDFTLDVNNPDDPKIVCVGNNPDRQTIYGTTLALFTSRFFRCANHPGKLPCGVLLDELPTIFIKGLDNLIATARSNKMAILFGAQDESQLRRDYGKEESEVLTGTVGTVYTGQVNGRTAKSISEFFGKEFRRQESETQSDDSSSVNVSWHQQEILPADRIMNFTQGVFCGRVADDYEHPIDKKCFCGEIVVDEAEMKRKKARWRKLEPVSNSAFDDAGVERRVMADEDGYLRAYVAKELREEELRKKYADDQYSAYTPGSVEETMEIDDRMGQYDAAEHPKERAEKLRAIVKAEQDEAVQKIMKDNYYKIKADIRELFYKEGVMEYEDDDVAQPPKTGGDGTGPMPDDPTDSGPSIDISSIRID